LYALSFIPFQCILVVHLENPVAIAYHNQFLSRVGALFCAAGVRGFAGTLLICHVSTDFLSLGCLGFCALGLPECRCHERDSNDNDKHTKKTREGGCLGSHVITPKPQGSGP